ncbi:MAG: DUF5916 domain-containing protein [Pyrinomonadaceae bacterium]
MKGRLLLILITMFSSVLLVPAQSPGDQATSQAESHAVSLSPEASETRAAGTSGTLPPEKARPLRIPRFEKPPVIDGHLDEQGWQHAAILKDFYQTQPGDNIAPSKETEVLLGYNANTLYIGIRAHDEAGKVRATVAKRDDVSQDDSVRIVLDTYNDQRKAYILIFNPLGVQQDGILTEGVGEDYSVDIVMDSKGELTDDGYVVEVAVPFKSLRYAMAKDKLWGIHAFRRIKRFNNELDSWMPISRNVSGLLNQEGHIFGLESISTERTLEIIPSLTLSETGKRVRTVLPQVSPGDPLIPGPGRFVNEPLAHELGLTAKLGLASNVTLDFALNPDFAQVEADQTVVTANQRFPIFFEEKRPFFLEGIDIFQTPLTPVHTRAIISPDFAVKLTGKRGPNTFGLLFASDRAPGDFSGDERLDPANRPFLDKNASIGVIRLKHDVGKESSLGFTATSYNFIQRHNQLAAIDGRFRLNPQTTFDFQVIGTTSRQPFFDADAGSTLYQTRNGYGYYFNYEMSGRHYGYHLSGQGRTRDYRADVGFTPRTNTNQEDIFVRYNSEPQPKARLIAWHAFNSLRPSFDWQGRMQNWTNETQVSFDFKRQTSVGAGMTFGYERLFEEEFGARRTPTQQGAFFGSDPERSTYRKGFYAFASTTPSKKFSIFLLGAYTRGAFDFDFGAGSKFPRVSPAALLDPNAPLDPGAGDALSLSASFKLQPTDALNISLDYTKSRLVRNDTGRVAFDDNIYTLHSTYYFTRFLSARARVDYDTLNSNVRGQFLLGWVPNPGTAFYIGYNDDLNRNGFNPFTGQLEPGFRRNGRTFFIKVSYLFRRSL